MRFISKIIFTVFFISGIAACKLPPIKYVTQTPPAIAIPAASQPVRIVVVDERKNPEPGEKEIKLIEIPKDRIHAIMKERMEANNVQVSESEDAAELKIIINVFKAVNDGGYWNSHIHLTFINEFRTQNIETQNRVYNLSSKDAVKALNLSLSIAIDDIKWNEFYPE